MYKIGFTSGLEELNTDEGKETVKIVGEIVDKLAKKCEDVPKKMTAPNKIMEITDGCFSSAQVVEVKDEKSGAAAAADAAAAEAEQAAEDAAKTSGSCGGGKSSESTDKQPTEDAKSCCGGKSNIVQDAISGVKLVESFIPSTLVDMAESGIQNMLGMESVSSEQFINSYCVYQPFPECATCTYGAKLRREVKSDIYSLFKQLREAIAALVDGDYLHATRKFVCPGLSNALLDGNLGAIANIAGANAVASIFSVSAVRGALEAYTGISTDAQYTDFRRDVIYCISDLFKSGSCVGIPGAFTSELNKVLKKIGATSNIFTKALTRSGSSKSSRFGAGYNLWGKKSTSTKRATTTKTSAATANKTSKVTGKKIYAEESPVDDSLQEVAKSGSRQTPSTVSIAKADVAREESAETLTAAKEAVENPEKAKAEGKLKPTKETKTHVTTTDKTAQPGKTYYKKDGDKYIEIEVEDGESLEQIDATYGPIFEVEDNGITEPDPTPIEVTEETVAENGKIYTYKDPATEKQVEIEVKPGEKLKDKKDQIEAKIGTPVVISEKPDPQPTYLTYKKTQDQKVQEGKTYYKKKPDGTYEKAVVTPGEIITEELYTQEVEECVSYQEVTVTEPVEGVTYYIVDETGLFVEIDVSTGFPEDKKVYEKIEVPIGSDAYGTEFHCSGPCVLNNGLMIAEPTFLDMASLDMGVDTTAFNNGGRTPAAEMAKAYGLGLSLYEVKMCYLLDHVRNGSLLPVDVEASEIPTILDTVADND